MSHKCKCGNTLPDGSQPFELCARCKHWMKIRFSKAIDAFRQDNEKRLWRQKAVTDEQMRGFKE